MLRSGQSHDTTRRPARPSFWIARLNLLAPLLHHSGLFLADHLTLLSFDAEGPYVRSCGGISSRFLSSRIGGKDSEMVRYGHSEETRERQDRLDASQKAP